MINIRCPLNTTLGYGVAAWNIVQNLPEPTIFPIGQPYLTSGNTAILKDGIMRDFDKNAPCLTIWHEHDLITNFVGKGQHIAFPFFELNKFDKLRMRHLQAADKIIVASQWAKDVIQSNGISVPTYVVPLGVDESFFFPRENDSEPYRFFSIGKYEYRKGTELILEMFAEAFPLGTENCEIYLFADSQIEIVSKKLMEFVEAAQAKYNDPRIKILRGGFSNSMDVADFIRQNDCGIFPTRSEGFGLPILESLSCGKHVITTNYSGHTAFCNAENSMLVDVKEFEPAIDGVWFHGLGTWAKIDKSAFVEHMKRAYNDNMRYNQAGIDTARKLTWSTCANKIMEVINDLGPPIRNEDGDIIGQSWTF